MRPCLILIALILPLSPLQSEAREPYLNSAREYLAKQGYDDVESMALEVSAFNYDLNLNGKKEIQVSPKCRFESPCLKVIFADHPEREQVLFHFEEYDYFPTRNTIRPDGYIPLRMIQWHGNFRHTIYIWVSGFPEFLNCSQALEQGIVWNNQQVDCGSPDLLNP